MPAAERAEIRDACAKAGIASQRPALAAGRAGRAVDHHAPIARCGRRASMSCAARSSFAPSWAAPISCTARRRSGASAAIADAPARAEEAWAAGAPSRPRRRAWPIASSRWPRPDCNFVNTLAEAADDRAPHRQSGAAHHGRHAGGEPDGARAGGRRRSGAGCRPGLIAHIQFNDRNRRGPGAGRRRIRAGPRGAARNRL